MVRIDLKDLSAYLISATIIIINIPSISRIFGGAGILILLFFIFMINYKTYLVQGTIYGKAALYVIVYCSFELLYELLGISNCEYIYYYYTISFFAISFIGPPLIESFSAKQKNIILISSFGSLIYLIIYNFLAREQYGNRYVRLGDYISGTNVISTQFFSAFALLCGALFVLVMYSKKNKPIMIILTTIIFVFVVYVGQRMIIIICLSVMLFLQYFISQGRSMISRILTIVALLAVLLVLLNIQTILMMISSSSDNIRITRRINQLLFVMQNGEIEGAGGSLEARLQLIYNSLRTFVSSPISLLFGIGENRSTNLLIGHHSDWIDQAAKYGIIGVGLMFCTLHNCFKALRSSMNIENYPYLYKQLFLFELYFIVRGLLGAVLYPYIAIALFVIIPILLSKVKEEEILQEENNDCLNM